MTRCVRVAMPRIDTLATVDIWSAREWLEANRCPHCTKRNQVACPYQVKQRIGGDGWTCAGYRCDVESQFRARWAK